MSKCGQGLRGEGGIRTFSFFKRLSKGRFGILKECLVAFGLLSPYILLYLLTPFILGAVHKRSHLF